MAARSRPLTVSRHRHKRFVRRSSRSDSGALICSRDMRSLHRCRARQGVVVAVLASTVSLLTVVDDTVGGVVLVVVEIVDCGVIDV